MKQVHHVLERAIVVVCSARVTVLLAVLLAASLPARADVVRARQHFDAGTRAFDEHRLADAAREFELAYEAEPAFQVLYNLGTVYAALGDSVAAVRAFDLYLEQADASAPAERVDQVRVELERQRARTATVWLSVEPAGAEVRVDAKLVGKSPLSQPLQLSAGRRTLEVSRDGYRNEHRELEVAGRTQSTLTVQLEPIAKPSDARATSTERSVGAAQRAIGWSIGGLGVGGLIAGTVVLVKARYKHFDAVDLAERDQRDRAERFEDSARRQQTLSYGVLGVAGAVFVTGMIVIWTSPRPEPATRLHISPFATTKHSGVSAQLRF